MANEPKKYYQYQYQYDSTAKAYPERVEPTRVPTPSEPRRKVSPSKRRKVDKKFAIQMSLCSALVFGFAISYIHQYATLRITQSELAEVKSQKIKTLDEITKVQAQIDQKLDLSEIEKKAKEQLNMTKPYPHQIVYLELPQKSYTTYEETK